MASIANDPNGTKRLLYIIDGAQKKICLGKMSDAAAQRFKDGFENLIGRGSDSLDRITAAWLEDVDDALYQKLVDKGFVPPRVKAKPRMLAEFIDAYIADRTDTKPGTITNLKAARRELVEFFGAEKALTEITAGDAEQFWRYMLRARPTGENKRKALGQNTARRVIGRAKQFFGVAIDHELLTRNPFKKIKSQVGASDASRDAFITREMADKVLAKCPNIEWKLIFALSRYGGLRCPSEHLALKWSDIHWDIEKITVHSPKTEHHEGKESRMIPLFPELRLLLEQAQGEQQLNSDLSEFVISRRRANNGNLRTHLHRIIRRAGLEPWPKTFHNLRATRETELAATHPAHVVCEWIGNSEDIARKHYLRVTDDDFAKAIEKTARNEARESEGKRGNVPETVPPVPAGAAMSDSDSACESDLYPRQDGNNRALSLAKPQVTTPKGTDQGTDPDLAELIARMRAAWPLPAEKRAAILALLRVN